MRLNINDEFLVFHQESGEYSAKITEITKKNGQFQLIKKIKETEQTPLCHLIFAPIKTERLQVMIEKSVELGVSEFTPIITQNTNAKLPNLDKIHAWIKNSVEQSQRINFPVFNQAIHLHEFLAQSTHNNCDFLYGKEIGQAPMISEIAKEKLQNITKICIGPEGGFSAQEMMQFSKHPNAHAFSLGQFILRSETAALSAVSYCNLIKTKI